MSEVAVRSVIEFKAHMFRDANAELLKELMMARTFPVGLSKVRWACVDYACHGYEGFGWAYVSDGLKVWRKDLGHCSCFGPCERADWMECDIEGLKAEMLANASPASPSVFDEDSGVALKLLNLLEGM